MLFLYKFSLISFYVYFQLMLSRLSRAWNDHNISTPSFIPPFHIRIEVQSNDMLIPFNPNIFNLFIFIQYISTIP